MKKLFLVLMVLAVAFTAFAQGGQEAAKTEEVAIAMVTDYGDITDQSFNQTTYEACRDYAAAQGLKFNYFKPTGDADAERVKSITQAVEAGYNVVVMPGYAFGPAILEAAPLYPDVKFIALDVSEFDLGGTVPANVYAAVYQEEIAGFFAGYAAVKLGYTKLGYLGGMAVPAVVRYGYGFVQGVDAAAKETGAAIELKYVYGNQFWGDADITAAMDTWYKAGTEVVFACGGGIYTSAAEAAAKFGGKVIGVDVDQAPIIGKDYGDITVTSAMKGLYASTQAALKTIAEDNNWASLAGKSKNLGLVSADPELNFVGIPTGAGTQWAEGKFTLADYKSLVSKLLSGSIKVDNAIDVAPEKMAKNFKVIDLGTIK